MKKYISLLSLTAAIVLQSCDRSDLVAGSENEILPKQQMSDEQSFARSESINEAEDSPASITETGEDEEPRKDKSHWRTQNDTVR